MEDKTILSIFGMVLLVVIEMAALHNGIDGVLLSAVIAVIAGLAGYNAQPIIEKIKGLKK